MDGSGSAVVLVYPAGVSSNHRSPGTVQHMGFVPEDWVVPEPLSGLGFRLEPLGPEHNERDHDAWMSSIEHIHSTPGFDQPDSTWPVPMTLDRNLDDLTRHRSDFEERKGFTYSILDDDDDVVGCLYIYPSESSDHDAAVSSWVRADRAELDRQVWTAVGDWLRRAWPFETPDYAARPDS